MREPLELDPWPKKRPPTIVIRHDLTDGRAYIESGDGKKLLWLPSRLFEKDIS